MWRAGARRPRLHGARGTSYHPSRRAVPGGRRDGPSGEGSGREEQVTTLALLASIALAAGATASPATPAAPATCSLPRAATWREHRSRHFLIDATDAGPSPERLVQVFE